MPKAAKRKTTPFNGSASTAPSSNTNKGLAEESKTAGISRPWIKAPHNLEPFLARLDPSHLYICSLDHKDRAFKRRLFCVPLLLNILLTVLLLWRIRAAFPTYAGIFLSTLGYNGSYAAGIHASKGTTGGLLGLGIERTFMFLGDFLLIRLIGQWPKEFFLGRGNIFSTKGAEPGPVNWRRAVSFRACEIIVRQSRRWDVAIFGLGENTPSTGGNSQKKSNIDFSASPIDAFLQAFDSQDPDAATSSPWIKIIKERILPAINPRWIRDKTGYQMLDKSWDLQFAGMIHAHALVDEKINSLDDYQTTVLIASPTHGWLAWQVWRDHHEIGISKTDGNDGNDGTGINKGNDIDVIVSSEQAERSRQVFVALGKEDLFFRSIEIIQKETSLHHLSREDRRQNAIDALRGEFREQSVDFDAICTHLGGVDQMPGLAII